MEINKLTCFISLNEKGFWQADVFNAPEGSESPPVSFCAGKIIGEDQYGVISKMSAAFPGIKFLATPSGECEAVSNIGM